MYPGGGCPPILWQIRQTGNFGEYDIKGKTTMEYGYGGAIDGIAKVTLDGMCFYKAQ